MIHQCRSRSILSRIIPFYLLLCLLADVRASIVPPVENNVSTSRQQRLLGDVEAPVAIENKTAASGNVDGDPGVVSNTTIGDDTDRCIEATTCAECNEAATFLFQDSGQTCAWQITKGIEIVGCEKVGVFDVVGEGDMCSKTTNNSTSPTNNESDESNLGAILGLLFLLACGGAAFKFKDKILSQLGGPDTKIGGYGNKSGKYHEVAAVEEDDGEWGWGGEDDDDGGDVELAYSKDDSSVHKRRSPPSSSSPAQPKQQSLYTKSSPSLSLKKQTHVSIDPAAPPGSSGLALKAQTSIGGRANKSHRAPSSVASPAPASAPVDYTSSSSPQRITTLGKNKSGNPPAAKKKPPAPSPEDDIFASMGLSSTPKFAHVPTPALAPKPTTTSTSASRWAQPAVATPTFAAPAPAMHNLGATSMSLDDASDGGGDDDDWDDDGDLDDLLDD